MTDARAPAELQAWFRSAGLVMPDLPPGLVDRLDQIGPTMWATDLDGGARRDPRAFLEGALEGTVDQQLLVGWSGHGLTSNFFHLRLADDALVLVVVLPLGNPVDDGDSGVSTVSSVLSGISGLHAGAVEATEQGRLRGRLVVLYDWPHLDSRFAVTGTDPLEWTSAARDRLIDEATAFVRSPGSRGVGHH